MNLGAARPRGETSEERRERKAGLKQERKESRQRKKMIKQMWTDEEQRMRKLMAGSGVGVAAFKC